MSIEELKQYHNAARYDSEDIAERLIELSNLRPNVDDPDTLHKELEEALYQINATAQNPYNNDYYRVLYNVLLAITGLDFD